MSLIDEIRKQDKKGLFTSDDVFASYTTGFAPLDYANGFYMDVKNDKTNTMMQTPVIGVIGGVFITIIGKSGSGKTTLADQIGANIIRPFKDGLLIHVDSEKTMLKQRLCDITGLKPEDNRLILRKSKTSIEDVFELVEQICASKASNPEVYKYEVPSAIPGKTSKVYVPTVIVIDSIYTFSSRDRKETELEGNMASNREAKEIAQFYSKCLNNMAEYNITIIAINHIKTKIEANPFAHTASQLVMIKQGETIPRGDAPLYLSQNVFRCTITKPSENTYTIEKDGFSGYKVQLQIAKTKTAFIGTTVNLVLNSKFGFDPIFTLYEFAKDGGLIGGRNPYLYFIGYEDIKFNRIEFRKRYIEDKEFRDMVNHAIRPALISLIGSKDYEGEVVITSDDYYVDPRDLESASIQTTHTDKSETGKDSTTITVSTDQEIA